MRSSGRLLLRRFSALTARPLVMSHLSYRGIVTPMRFKKSRASPPAAAPVEEDVWSSDSDEESDKEEEVPGVEGEEKEIIIDPEDDLKKYSRYMSNTIDKMKRILNTVKLGRASPDLFDHLEVEAYGAKMPFTAVAQTMVKNPTLLVVNVHDPSLANEVKKVIEKSGMGLNPVSDSGALSIQVPKPSQEARVSLIKTANSMAQKAKGRISHFYKTAHKRQRKWINEKDLLYQMETKLKAVNEQQNAEIKQILAAKIKSLEQ